MAPFSYIREESFLGLIGIFVLLFYIIYISYIKRYNRKCSFKLTYVLFIIHLIVVLFLVLGMKCTIQYSNEGWYIPWLFSLIFDLLRYKLKKMF